MAETDTAAPAKAKPAALKKGALVRVNRKAYAGSVEACASDPTPPDYIFEGPGEILQVKGDYAQVRWRRPGARCVAEAGSAQKPGPEVRDSTLFTALGTDCSADGNRQRAPESTAPRSSRAISNGCSPWRCRAARGDRRGPPGVPTGHGDHRPVSTGPGIGGENLLQGCELS